MRAEVTDYLCVRTYRNKRHYFVKQH